jgi:hypothetical protein
MFNGTLLFRTIGRECARILGKGMPPWEKGAPAPQERVMSSSWFRTVEEERHSSMTRDTGDGPATTSRGSYAQSECCRALYKQVT